MLGNSTGTWEHVENPLRTQCEHSENLVGPHWE